MNRQHVITGPGLYVRADGGTATVNHNSLCCGITGNEWVVCLHDASVTPGCRDVTLYYRPDGRCNIGHYDHGKVAPLRGHVLVCPANVWMAPPAGRPDLPDRTVVDIKFNGTVRRYTVGDVYWDVWARRHSTRGVWRVPDPRRADVKVWRDGRPVWPAQDKRDLYWLAYGGRLFAPISNYVRRVHRRQAHEFFRRVLTVTDHGTFDVEPGRLDRLGTVRERLEPGDVAELRDGIIRRYEGER